MPAPPLAHGGDDAAALAEGAFVIAHHGQDRAAAREALETAVSLSPLLGVRLHHGRYRVRLGRRGGARDRMG